MKYLLLTILLFSNIALGQDFVITKAPSWVNNDIFNSVTYNADKKQDIAYLLTEIQYNIEQKPERFHRQIISINTLQGLSQLTHYNIDYDPTYQQVELHKISVKNSQETVSQLDPKYIKVLSLEDRLNENIYTGNKRINILLEALNVNDVVTIEFTIKGENPVFKGYFFDELALQSSIYTYNLHYRLLHNRETTIQSKIHGKSEVEIEFIEHSKEDKSWLLKNIPAIVIEENVPSSYIAYPWLQLSQFTSWVEVKEWASGLFYDVNTASVYERLNNRAYVTDWYNKVNNTTFADTQLNIAELLFAVRNNLRYTMNAQGVHSHLAHSPLEIVTKGYGDCKDKVNIILAHQNSQFKQRAYPVLVNSKIGKNIDQWLPTPSAFDHAIVLYQGYDEKEYWLDPTINTSIEDFKNQLSPDYGFALILQSTADDIYPMSYQEPPIRDIIVKETIDLSEANNDVTLDVTIELNAFGANNVRELINKDTEQLSKQLLNNYQNIYPEIRLLEDVVYNLNDDNHKLTLHAKLVGEPSAFWHKQDEKRVINIAPINLSPYLPNGIRPDRKHPFYVPGIVNYKQSTKIIKPFEINDKFPQIQIRNNNFDFSQYVTNNQNSLDMIIEYRMKTDTIMQADFEDYNKEMKELRNSIGIRLFVDFPNIENISDKDFSVKAFANHESSFNNISINWTLFMMVLFALIPMGYVLNKVSSLKLPSSFKHDVYKQGFEGPLFFMAIAIGLGLLITLAMSFRLIPFFTEQVWAQYTNTSSDIYHSVWGAYLPFIIIMEVFILITTVTFTYQFFKKRYSAKLVFITLQSSKFLLLGVSYLVGSNIAASLNSIENLPNLLNMSQDTIIFSGIFQLGLLAYMLTSSQVKNTLIK